MKRLIARTTALICAAVVALLVGCGTSVEKTHPLVEAQPDVAAARVYFIRPFTYRERGVADNPVKIELNGMSLLKLGKGEYTMLRLKPGKARLTTRNRTTFTNKNEPVEMTREATLDFTQDKVYFLHVRQVNEEFRGVYYLVEPVDLATAKGLIEDAAVIGAARGARIEDMPLPQ